MTPEQEIERGRQAKELLEHPLMVEAVQAIQSRLVQEWADSPVRDKEGREHIWRLQSALKAVMGHLRTTMESGEMASLKKPKPMFQPLEDLKDRAVEWLSGG